jgi:hypothetical protein
MLRSPALGAVLWLVAGSTVAHALPSVTPILEARARLEAFDALRVRGDQEARYHLALGRVRLGAEVAFGQRFRLKGIVQAAGMRGVPENAAFGAGPVYFTTNGGDTSPAGIGLAELAFTWREPSFELTVGRQGFAEGVGAPTGIAHLDGVAHRRLAERLIGNLDFPNVGRRFDGVLARSGVAGVGRFEIFAFRPLAGAFHYDDAFDRLDVELFGVNLASPYGGWLPRTQVRVFALGYRDDRPAARAVAGGRLEIDTLGGSLLTGSESWNLLVWSALQRGDWGARTHSADALVLELGRRFAGIRGAPSIHLGYERASGGDRQARHGAFFNLLPTNHKFYGALDYLAFSNLRDLFLEGRVALSPRVRLQAALHDFALVDRGDAWYGGSGAMSARELGYVARRPAGGRYDASDLGRELDLTLFWTLSPALELKLESGVWRGGAAAEQFARADADGAWLALEATWRLP